MHQVITDIGNSRDSLLSVVPNLEYIKAPVRPSSCRQTNTYRRTTEHPTSFSDNDRYCPRAILDRLQGRESVTLSESNGRLYMSCSYFKNKYDLGFCSASPNIHIPIINEMSCFCFKDDYHLCPIFCNFLAEKDFLPHVGSAGDGGHSDHQQGRSTCLG